MITEVSFLFPLDLVMGFPSTWRFSIVLNQLIYADMYNLKPCIDLVKDDASAVYDKSVHDSVGVHMSFEMPTADANVKRDLNNQPAEEDSSYSCPGNIDDSSLNRKSIVVSGVGSWELGELSEACGRFRSQ